MQNTLSLSYIPVEKKIGKPQYALIIHILRKNPNFSKEQ